MVTQIEFKCEYCGSRKDVTVYEFMGTIGMIILSWRESTILTLCEKHKKRRITTAIFLTFTCLTIGWWSIPAFFWNFAALYKNIRGGEKIASNIGISIEEVDIPEEVLRPRVLELLQARSSDDFNVRINADKILKKIGKLAVPIIIEKLQESKDKSEIQSYIYHLGDLDDERAIPVLKKISQENEKRAVRKRAKETYKEMEKRKKRREK